MKDITLSVRIEGRVQGVWFRGWTRDEAQKLGLRGWVRNEQDGSVAACVAGPEARVRDLVASMHRGPPAARVRNVSWRETAPYSGGTFDVRR